MGDRIRRLRASVVAAAKGVAARPLVVVALAITLVGTGLAVSIGSQADERTVQAGAPSTTVGADAGGLFDSTRTTPLLTSTTSTTSTTEATTTSTTSATTTTTVRTGPSRRIAADPKGRWAIELTAAGCIDLVLQASRHDRLLCNAQPAAKPLGALVAVSTAIGRMAVAVAQADVTSFDSSPQCAGAFHYDATAGRHPDRADMAYVAGLIAPCSTSATVHAGPHTVARLIIPAEDRTYPSLDQHTGSPYGRWKGYRQAGQSGYYFGGHQVIGFYDGGGGPCLLYRRLGGTEERVIAEGCPVGGGGAIQVATLSPLSVSDATGRAFTPAALTKEQGVVLHLELPGGEKRSIQSQVAPDSASPWLAVVQAHGHVMIPHEVGEVSFVLTRGSAEVARTTVPVPR